MYTESINVCKYELFKEILFFYKKCKLVLLLVISLKLLQLSQNIFNQPGKVILRKKP